MILQNAEKKIYWPTLDDYLAASKVKNYFPNQVDLKVKNTKNQL
jgi:hypothetical protein